MSGPKVEHRGHTTFNSAMLYEVCGLCTVIGCHEKMRAVGKCDSTGRRIRQTTLVRSEKDHE